MENKINIAEFLKDCPKGMELDCTMYENVTLIHILEGSVYPIKIGTPDGQVSLTEYGQYSHSKLAKCVIFPKGKTTWEGFVPPCRFKDGDVLFHSDSASNGIFIFKEILQCGSIQKVICYCDYDSEDGFCLGENHTCCYTDSKILHPATKEQREILFQKMKEAGYKWNTETKTLEKLIEPKFKVGDKVRYKDDKTVIIITGIKDDYYFIQFYDIRKNDYQTERVLFKDQDKYELIIDNQPIFKVGDKIRRKGSTRLITIKDVRDNYYIITILDGFNICYITDKLLFSNQDKYELVPNKFDINTLNPFDKVLVRDNMLLIMMVELV